MFYEFIINEYNRYSEILEEFFGTFINDYSFYIIYIFLSFIKVIGFFV